MTQPVLYSFRRCPYAMRARMALAVSGEQVELREVVLKNKPDEMLAASPKGTVPVLIDQKAGVIDESLEVMRWALARNDPERWLSKSDDALIAENDGPFKRHLDRYKYSVRYDDADPVEHRSAGRAFLERLEGRLSATGWLSGTTRGFSDIAIFPFARQFRIADPDWFDAMPTPALHDWLRRCVEADLFLSIMKKYEPWKSGERGVAFP
ncbi:MAG: glutathione S-transferase [Pseudomonadota bacterium]